MPHNQPNYSEGERNKRKFGCCDNDLKPSKKYFLCDSNINIWPTSYCECNFWRQIGNRDAMSSVKYWHTKICVVEKMYTCRYVWIMNSIIFSMDNSFFLFYLWFYTNVMVRWITTNICKTTNLTKNLMEKGYGIFLKQGVVVFIKRKQRFFFFTDIWIL